MDVSKIIADAQQQRRANISKNFVNKDVLVEKAETEVTEDDIVKSIISEEVEENPFEKAVEAAEEDIEKSDIYHALNEGKNITFKKTGKEIKESIASKVLPKLNADLAVKQSEIDNLLAACGKAPNKDADYWYTSELNVEVPYKIYRWDETYFNSGEQKNSTIMETLSPSQDAEVKAIEALKNYPENKEQADNRERYNTKVREICEILVDVKACEIISAIEDSASVDLTPKQVIAFCL